ncbi:hypothetical protein [Rhodococcus sp. NPDC127528]
MRTSVAGPGQATDNPLGVGGEECVEFVGSPAVAHARFARRVS